MKRFHVHLSVPDLASSIRFYSGMFGFEPTVAKPDYAKWMLDEPRVNFAISARGGCTGLNHLGLQADSADELAEIRGRFDAAERGAVVDEIGAHCCYAVSDKHWVRDPQGIAWEAFHSLGTIPVDEGGDGGRGESACCAGTGDIDATTAPKSSGGCAPSADATQRQSVSASPTRACCG